MHELSVTHSLLKLALHHAEAAGAVKITGLTLVIGELSSIVDDSVQFYWDMVAEGTIAYGAILTFKRVPAALRCEDCGQEFPLDRERFTCPYCDSSRVVVARGDDFFLESIDVDFAPETS